MILGVQQAHGVGRDRVSEAGTKLFGHRRSADHRPALEDLDLESRHAEVGGASQPVMTRTDDDDVVLFIESAICRRERAGRNGSCPILIHAILPA